MYGKKKVALTELLHAGKSVLPFILVMRNVGKTLERH